MSAAKTQTLEPLLQDAAEINKAHSNLRTGLRGRQWGLGGLNRSAIVLAVSAWEAYVEDLAIECVELIRPVQQPAVGQPWPLRAWPAINAATRTLIGRFNTPNSRNVISLLATAIGLTDVTIGWHYRACSRTRAVALLDALLDVRHEIAHGVNPRPAVHNGYARWAPMFVQRIAECTEVTVRDYLVNVLGIAAPW